jgi:hypothetical protein
MSYLDRKEKEALTSRYLQFRAPSKNQVPEKLVSAVSDTPEQGVLDRLLQIIAKTWKFTPQKIVNAINYLVPDPNPVEFNEPIPTSLLSNYGRIDIHETHGGHVIITDDTEGNQRIIHQHANGSYTAMLDDGDSVRKSMKDLYHFVGDPQNQGAGNWYVNIYGHQIEVIQGDNRIVIQSSRDVSVEEDDILNIDGDQQQYLRGNKTEEIAKNHSTLVRGNSGTKTEGYRTDVTEKDKATGVRGSHDETVDVNVTKDVGGKVKETIGSTWDVTARGRIYIHSDTEVKVTAPVINLN